MRKHPLLSNSISALIATLAIGFPFPTFANQAINFSPYADITINAYWDSQFQDMEPMNLVSISQATGIKSYHLAFITDAGSCTPAWGGQASYSVSNAWGAHLTDKMRANSINYIISFGGANGNDISNACSESQLISAFEQVVKTYQPLGLDFDIENGSTDVPKLINALQQFQQSHPNVSISFTLPVLPEGLVVPGQEVVKQARANNLNYSVNIMAMDYGPAYSKDMGEYAVEAAKNLFNFLKSLYPNKSDHDLWQMVEVTPMIGVNDVEGEYFTLQDVDLLRRFAEQTNLRSLSMWSIARDNPCADKWSGPICSGNNLQSQPYEFAKRFIL